MGQVYFAPDVGNSREPIAPYGRIMLTRGTREWHLNCLPRTDKPNYCPITTSTGRLKPFSFRAPVVLIRYLATMERLKRELADGTAGSADGTRASGGRHGGRAKGRGTQGHRKVRTRSKRGGGSARVPVLVASGSKVVWGSERLVISLAPLMAERGFDLLVGSPPDGDFARQWKEAGGEHIALDIPATGGLRRPGGDERPSPASLARDLGRVWESAGRVAKETKGCALLHSNSLHCHAEIALAGRRASLPTVVHLHDLVRPGMGRYALGVAVAMSTVGVAISPAVAGCVPKAFRRHVQTIPNGVDLTRFAPAQSGKAVAAEIGLPDAPLVGIVGRIDPEKGIITAIRAVAECKGGKQPPHLVVLGATMGDPRYLDVVRKEGERLLGDRIHFLEPRADVENVVSSFSVLVNASRAEPFGMTIIEAQAMGVPVVAASGGGVGSIIQDGVNGLLVPPGDELALARALEAVLSSEPLAESLSVAGRENVVANFGLDRMADRLAALYGRMLATARRA